MGADKPDSQNASSDGLSYGGLMAVGGFALGAVLAAAFVHLPGSSSDWASWIQAFGSIGAILGAAFVVWYQTRDARSQAEQAAAVEQRQKAEGLFAICELAEEQANAAGAAFQGEVVNELELALSYSERFFNETFHALDSIQLAQFGFPEGVPVFIRLKLAYGAIGRAISSSRFGDGTETQTDASLCLDIQQSQRLVAQHVESLQEILLP
ncbi:hypothetical protein [Paraburkholderia aspalathi]|uniref:hypothetical protein n=1 Tax=Paraburkholderia aspalathi TaxID=1324617 RepID=UPI0038BD4A10